MPIACSWLTSTVCSTPAAARASIWVCTAPTVSGLTTTLRGEEMSASSGGVRPISPTCTPPVSTTTEGAMRWASTRACRAGSAEKSRFALMNGTSAKEEMNSAVMSGPKSNSWLASEIAS